MTTMVHLFGGEATTAERSKELLGGKGSNLAEMASIGLPSPALRSPPTSARIMSWRAVPAVWSNMSLRASRNEGVTGSLRRCRRSMLVSVR